MASGSEVAAKFAELKKDVVEILSSCEGHCLDLGRFKEEYKNRFRKKFDKQYKVFKTGWKFKNLMGELDDVIYLEESKHHKSVVVMKLKEPADSSHATTNPLTLPDKSGASADVGFQQVNLHVDSKPPAKSPLSPVSDKESTTATSANTSSQNNDSSNVSGRTFLKAQRRLKKKSTESKEKDHERTGENTAGLISPSAPSSPESSAMFLGESLLGLPLSPPPVPRLEASGIFKK